MFWLWRELRFRLIKLVVGKWQVIANFGPIPPELWRELSMMIPPGFGTAVINTYPKPHDEPARE